MPLKVKNKLYDNSALEMSTQRSSMANGGQPNYMSNSMYQQQDSQIMQEQQSVENNIRAKYRTDSAQKPFGIKKPPMNSGRAQSGIPGGVNR